ncbi:hypothetical protein BX666DRAFT_1281290 [Dichotomocladium elegans]|nr:hypothetical protein BX666DRAFT_1281290 [Dichotomocladium elegans]
MQQESHQFSKQAWISPSCPIFFLFFCVAPKHNRGTVKQGTFQDHPKSHQSREAPTNIATVAHRASSLRGCRCHSSIRGQKCVRAQGEAERKPALYVFL